MQHRSILNIFSQPGQDAKGTWQAPRAGTWAPLRLVTHSPKSARLPTPVNVNRTFDLD